MGTDAGTSRQDQAEVVLAAAPVVLRLFGAVELSRPGADATVFRRERRFQLLAYLACHRGWVSRDELATFLWPERTQSAARSNLRKTLLLAQRVPGLSDLQVQGDRMRWQPDSDLTRFEADADAGRHAHAMAWRRGPLMDGLEEGLDVAALEWIAFQRQRVDSVWHRCASRALVDANDDAAAIEPIALAMLAYDPLDEAATLALARACAATGRAAQALAAIDSYVRRLDESMGQPPSGEFQVLARELRGGGSGAMQRIVSSESKHSAARRFVGRRLELSRIRTLIQSGQRCLTLIGPGGVGKSSLARAVVDGNTLSSTDDPRFPVHWLAVGDLTGTTEVVDLLAMSLDVKLQASTEPWTLLAKQVGAYQAWLVFDNADTVPGLGACLGDLLQACRGLRVIATARSALGTSDEVVLTLDGLPLPDRDEVDAEVLRNNDAVALFEARALAVQPSFTLEREASEVVALVHEIDGLPLAIELAAAWTRLLPVADVRAELAKSLEFLDPLDDAEAPRSLRATFARSWSMLSHPEQRALAALALLPGAFGREMAHQAADTPLAMLAALTHKSFLQADGSGRFAFHPLIQQFARKQAHQGHADEQSVAVRHASFVAHWLASFGPLREAPSRTALDAIEQDLVHLRAAWHRAVEAGDAAFVTATATSLMFFYLHRGSWTEGVEAMAGAGARFDASDRLFAEAGARALQGLAQLHDRSAQVEEAERAARRSLQLARRSGQAELVLDAFNLIGTSLWRQGRLLEARPFLVQALERSRRQGTLYQRSRACTNLSLVEKRLGEVDRAVALLEEALAMARELGSWDAMLHQLHGLATTHCLRCDWTAARAALDEALKICDEHGVEQYRPVVLGTLGRVLLEIGSTADAVRALESAAAEAKRFQRASLEAEALASLAEAHALLGRPSHARDLLRRVLANPAVAAMPTLQMTCLGAFSEILCAEGAIERGRDLLHWIARQTHFDEADRAITQRRLQRLIAGNPSLGATLPATPDDGTAAGVFGMLRREIASLAIETNNFG